METTRRTIAQLETEVGRLTEAVAAGAGDVTALVAPLRSRDKRLSELRQQLVAISAQDPTLDGAVDSSPESSRTSPTVR